MSSSSKMNGKGAKEGAIEYKINSYIQLKIYSSSLPDSMATSSPLFTQIEIISYAN